MLDGLISFVALFFGGLFVLGVLGFVVDKLSKCKWVDKALKRMIKE